MFERFTTPRTPRLLLAVMVPIVGASAVLAAPAFTGPDGLDDPVTVIADTVLATRTVPDDDIVARTLTLRAGEGNVVILEMVDDDGKVSRLEAKTITILDTNGKVSGSLSLLLEGGATLRLKAADGGHLLQDTEGAVRLLPPMVVEPRVRIGLTTEPVVESLAVQLGVEVDSSVMIVDVTEGLPARRAGLELFDVVTHIDGTAPATQVRLRDAVESKSAGEPLRLSVIRRGEPLELSVTVEAYVDETVDLTTPYSESLTQALVYQQYQQFDPAVEFLARQMTVPSILPQLQDPAVVDTTVDGTYTYTPTSTLVSPDRAADFYARWVLQPALSLNRRYLTLNRLYQDTGTYRWQPEAVRWHAVAKWAAAPSVAAQLRCEIAALKEQVLRIEALLDSALEEEEAASDKD